MAIVSAAWDGVGRRRLRHHHRGTAWLAADCGGMLTLLGNSGVVHRRKMAQETTWLASMAAVAVVWVAQRDAVIRWARFGYLMGILEHGATLFIILQRLKERIHDMEYCGGRGEDLACGVFCVATRARRRFNGGCGEAPARCFVAVVMARQPTRGSD